MRLIDKELIKALRCLASQDENGDCYQQHHNFIHADGDEPEIYCGSQPTDGRIECPYYQNKYEVCFECGEWLETVADELELQNQMKSKYDDEMAADIKQAIEYFKDELSQMGIFSDIISFRGDEVKACRTAIKVLQIVQGEIQTGKQEAKTPKRESQLEKLAREAREAGMTYGQYVALEYDKIKRG